MACAVYRIHVHRAGHLWHLGPMLDMGRDRSVRKVLDECPFPVCAEALRIERVEGAVQCRVWQRTASVGNDRRDLSKWLQHFLGLVEGACPVHNDETQGVA